MIKRQILTFLLRWLLSSIAMYICIVCFAEFKEGHEYLQNSWQYYAMAGLVSALIHSFVRPIVTIFALPVLFITLGIFTIIINAAMVALTIWIMPNVTISFWGAVGGCIVISIFNYLVNLVLPDVK